MDTMINNDLNILGNDNNNIINIIEKLNEIQSSKIDGDLVNEIWIDTIYHFKRNFTKRVVEGLYYRTLLPTSIITVDQVFDCLSKAQINGRFIFSDIINSFRKQLHQSMYQLFQDEDTENLKSHYNFFNNLIYPIIKNFEMRILKKLINETKYGIYIEQFDFSILEVFSSKVEAIHYNENLYFKEKEIIRKFHPNTYEVKNHEAALLKREGNYAIFMNDSAVDASDFYPKTPNLRSSDTYKYRKNTNQLISYSFNHLEELSKINLTPIHGFYYEPNYFNNKIETKQQLIDHYKYIKEKIDNKPIIVNLFRFDIIKYCYNLEDRALTKNALLNYMNMYKEDLLTICSIFTKSQLKFLIPYTEYPEEFLDIKQLIEKMVNYKFKIGVGIEIDQAVFDFEQYKNFSYSVIELDRFMEELYEENKTDEELKLMQLKNISDFHVVSTRRHKTDYIMGTSLSNITRLIQIRSTRIKHIILNKDQIEILIKLKL